MNSDDNAQVNIVLDKSYLLVVKRFPHLFRITKQSEVAQEHVYLIV